MNSVDVEDVKIKSFNNPFGLIDSKLLVLEYKKV